MAYYLKTPFFPSGDVFVSPFLIESGIDVSPLLRRHLTGCWGDISPDDAFANLQALALGEGILSQYKVAGTNGIVRTVIIVTEGDRSQTLVFVPGEGGFPVAPEV